MNLDNEELLVTKHKRKLISYTKQVASGKLDKNFYNAYCELYDLLCEYMNAYNRECKDYEQTIKELYEENKKLKSDNYNLDRENAKLFDRTIDLERIIDKTKGSKVTEQELKDMILGMLE